MTKKLNECYFVQFKNENNEFAKTFEKACSIIREKNDSATIFIANNIILDEDCPIYEDNDSLNYDDSSDVDHFVFTHFKKKVCTIKI